MKIKRNYKHTQNRYQNKIMLKSKKEQRQQIHDKFNGRCAYCGIELNGKFHIDHVISQEFFTSCIKNKYKVPKFLDHLTEHDVNHLDNLFPACQKCNNKKTANPLESFRLDLQESTKRLRNYAPNYGFALRFGLIEETNKPVTFYFETIKQ